MRVIYPVRYLDTAGARTTKSVQTGREGCGGTAISHGVKERDGNRNPTVSYTRGNDLSGSLEGAGGIGGLLARSSGYSSGSWSSHNYYHSDGGGNITMLLDGNQVMSASYRYDPYGNLISSSGALASANVYRFSSKEIHASSGMYDYGFRFYDPNLQRWINRDPLEELGSINLYAFVDNGPVTLVDTDGDAIFTKFTKKGIEKFIRSKTAHLLLQKGKNLCVDGGKKGVKREIEKAFPNSESLYHDRDSTARLFGGPHAQPSPRPRGNASHLFDRAKANVQQLRDAARLATAGFWVGKAVRDAGDDLPPWQGRVADGLAGILDAMNPLSCVDDVFEIKDELRSLVDLVN